ncbi:MAG: T9SS type A sorting domain-containing protein [Chlorobi bacterium]|nr:T9SS type A sorting domain-containing protein [Chlorobiota bacterium]
MKKLLLFLLLTTSLITFSQDFQVSNSGIASVDVPHLALNGSRVHLVYGTNFRYYNFDINGPTAPIDNPIIPVDNFGPNTTDIDVDPMDPNHIAIAYYDFHYDYDSDVQFYGCYITESFDGGLTFDEPTLLDTVEYGNTISNVLYNVPQVKFLTTDVVSDPYILWKVNSNKRVTNALYMSTRYGHHDRMDDPNKDAVEMAIGFTVEDMFAVSYAIMENAHVMFYLNGSGIVGPVLVKDAGQTFLTTDTYSKAFLNHGGRLEYIYNDINHSASLMESYDWGATWIDKGIVDNHKYTYVAFNRIEPTYPYYLESYYVKLLIDDSGDLVYSVSENLLNWQYGGKVNSSSAQVSGMASSFIDLKLDDINKFLITTWIDTRTGNEEIFYGKASLPELVSVEKEKSELPTEFVLEQNYPNPFNPSTTINYSIPANVKGETANVQLIVYDILGNELAILVDKKQAAGEYSVTFNADNFPSGLYLYKLQAGDLVNVKKMMLIK